MATASNNIQSNGREMGWPFSLVVAADHEAVSRCAADAVLAEIKRTPGLLIGAATGSTPTRMYEMLVERGRREPRLVSGIRILKIDEWGGLAMDDPATCEVYLREKLLTPLAVSEDRYLGWNSAAADPQAECARVAHWMGEHGPIDLCVLGLGANGHLAFNEPADSLRPGPHVAELSAQSLKHSMLGAAQGNPRMGLTIGMGDILWSRSILLLVSGRQKAQQLKRLFEPRIAPGFPASFLWLHGCVMIICDREAASLLDD